MVDRLGDALQIPLRERNRLLEMAGLAATYPQGDLDHDDLAPFQRAIDRLPRRHPGAQHGPPGTRAVAATDRELHRRGPCPEDEPSERFFRALPET